MNHKKLEEFDKILRKKSKNYSSMIAVGSIVTGDPYIEGRSDKDIVLIFKDNPKNEISKIEKIIKRIIFDESYFFTPIPRNSFGVANSKYCFSNKFRSKTLFGEDIIKEAILPDRESTRKIYLKGLEETSHQLYNQIINSPSWKTEKIKNKFWKQFKHIFMYLAIREYYFSGDYPQTRKEISERLNSKEINNTFWILHSIDNQPRESIIKCAKSLVKYIEFLD